MSIASNNSEKQQKQLFFEKYLLPEVIRPGIRGSHKNFSGLPGFGWPHGVRLSLFVFLLIVMLITSCSLFETRDPEDPGTTTVPVFIQPDRPQDVIQNLQNAVRALNLDNYRRCLAESFEYEPSSDAQSSNPDLWQGWGFAEEEVYFNNMRAEAEGLSGHELQLENRNPPDLIPPDQAIYETNYRITVQHNRQELPVTAEGRMRLFFTRDESGNWAIETWTDASGNSDFTWSDYRAAFF